MPRKPAVPFEAACSLLHDVLSSAARRDIVADLTAAASLGDALSRLRDGMRAHAFTAARQRISLERFVGAYDRLTRDEGFHVLHDWDGKADRVGDDAIPVDVLSYVARLRGDEPVRPIVLAILVDYYFVHVLALLSLRVWDEGDADENIERVNALLRLLQGPHGSGQPFVADAETLLLIATSHFEVQEIGYDRLLDRVRGLDRAHQVNIALGHASSMGSHLRFGFEATYARDTLVMRDDNIADYPWLCYALATVMREYTRVRDAGDDTSAARDANEEGSVRARLVEALLNGLPADARAFVGAPPSCLARSEPDRGQFVDAFRAHERELVEAFERFRPSDERYSPLSFFFNFSHNIVKGMVVDALLRDEPWSLTFNDLMTG